MAEAVIVSTARTGMAKSARGGFNNTHGAVLGGHANHRHRVLQRSRAVVEPIQHVAVNIDQFPILAALGRRGSG